MLIKLLATQIPDFWEVIKYGVIRADHVSTETSADYLNDLLLSLLNDKRICYVALDDNRNVTSLLILQIKINSVTDAKYLYMQCLYSYTSTSMKDWQDLFKFIKDFAEAENCKYLRFESGNKRLIDMAKSVGFKHDFVTMSLNVGGI